MNLLFKCDIVNLLLKNKGGKDRRPNFVIFVVWSALTLFRIGDQKDLPCQFFSGNFYKRRN